jgi:phage terminase large subunit GpA-like protein
MPSLLSPIVCDAIRPRQRPRTADWAARNVSLPPGSEIKGRLRLDLFPHVRDVFDAFDDPTVSTIVLQWASRLGKTVCAQVCLAKIAATDPHPMAFADADERSCRRVLKRLWRLLESVPALAAQVPPRKMQSSDRIELPDCLIHGAWSGSASTAADFAALVVALNEVDKMSSRASLEADFAQLMVERTKGYVRGKVLLMSTPSVTGSSRVETARLKGDNRRRLVPCPHCQTFQELRTGDGLAPGGLRWQKDSAGRSTPDLAARTAWYECAHCRERIEDRHRYELLNAGRWIPEGQEIDAMGRVTGTPLRPGPIASFGPLGTHHSLLPSITWGVIARKFVETRGNQEEMRNFRNSWEALTWDRQRRAVAPLLVAQRLGSDVPWGVCPVWSVFLTQAIDVGGAGDEFHWQVCAWGPNARGHVVAYGLIRGEPELAAHLDGLSFPHADGGRPLRPQFTLIDSGSGLHTDRVYAFCAARADCGPSKGMDGFPEFLKVTPIGQTADKERRRRLRLLPVAGRCLYEINHERSQKWIQELVNGDVGPDRGDWFSVAAEIAEGTAEALHGPFLAHFVNEVPGDEYFRHGDKLTRWERQGPNEQRDCARGNRALADYFAQHGLLWSRLARVPHAATPPPRPVPPVATPDGRAFVASQR